MKTRQSSTTRSSLLVKPSIWFLLAALLMSTGTGIGQAQPQADALAEYPVTPELGPWMICVASYMGEPAPKLAANLAMELRQRYHRPAFVYNRGAEQRRQQQAELEKQRRQQQEYLRSMGLDPNTPLRRRIVRIEEQYAVLVGGYKDIESARRDLDAIKKLEAPQSVPKDTYSTLGADPSKGQMQQTVVNPFATSFVVRNPTVPVERPPDKPDPFLKDLNDGETFSLLKCKHPWTLAVKEFHGVTVVQQQSVAAKVMDSLLGRNTGVQLDAGGQNAHNLAEALRKMGFEAYVLHTRYNSVVSIGGFDRPDDPAMTRIQESLAKYLQFKTDPSASAGQFSVQNVSQQVQLLARPLPMAVPQL